MGTSVMELDDAPRSSDGPMGRGMRGEDADPEERYGDDLSPGVLLEEPADPAAHRRIATAALRTWTDYHDLHARRLAEVRVNELRREGYPNVILRKEEGRNSYKAWYPEGASPDSDPAMNKSATLCRRMVSMLFADPPVAMIGSAGNEIEDETRAEAATRLLHDLQGEHGLNESARARAAMDLASTFRSGFVRYWIDDKGGGLQPVTIEAAPEATTVQDATHDPATGQPWPSPVKTRYVAEDGTLTDDPWSAAQEWVPGIKSELLTLRNVHLLPHTCDDLWDADGVQVGVFLAWSTVQAMFPDAVADLSDEEREQVFAFRPERAEDMMPDRKRDLGRRGKGSDAETLVFVLTTYYKVGCPDYPLGANVITLADRRVLSQDTLLEETPEGDVIPLDIPMTQYGQFREGKQDPYAIGLMDILGPGGELRWSLIAAALDHFDKFRNRKVFVPTNSILNARDFQLPTKTVLPINPGGEPTYEDIPDFPRAWETMFTLASQEMDSDSGLQQAAQGVEDPSVQSGTHAQTIIAQVHAGLSEISQNVARGYLRGSRIVLQLARVSLTVPRLVKWQGEDGRHRAKAFSSADLRGATDVVLKPGTNTMLSPPQKRAAALEDAQLGIIGPDELRDVLAAQIGSATGVQDNPFRLRIKRQLADWLDGPPEGWVEGVQAASQQAAAMGQQPQFLPEADPVLARIFTPSPADSLPQAAAIRLYELAKVMSSTRYEQAHPLWRAALDREFILAQTVGQQQMAAEQQAGAPAGPSAAR